MILLRHFGSIMLLKRDERESCGHRYQSRRIEVLLCCQTVNIVFPVVYDDVRSFVSSLLLTPASKFGMLGHHS